MSLQKGWSLPPGKKPGPMVLQESPIPPCAGWSHVPAKRVVPSPCKKLPSSGPLSLQTGTLFVDLPVVV
jgi:hypothetical protein